MKMRGKFKQAKKFRTRVRINRNLFATENDAALAAAQLAFPEKAALMGSASKITKTIYYIPIDRSLPNTEYDVIFVEFKLDRTIVRGVVTVSDKTGSVLK